MPTSAALRVVNQARILAALRRPGSHSRVSLSHGLGLTRSTVTVIITSLLEQGLVHEVVSEIRDPKATGRPRVEIELRAAGAYFGGLDLGNESLTAVIVDLNGHEVGRVSRELPDGSTAPEAEQSLVEMMYELLDARPGIRLEGIGLTVPGLVAPDGRLQWAPRLGWRDVTIGDAVRSAIGAPVIVENDANAAAIGEALLSQVENVPNLLYVLLESGVGAGLLVDGQLYRGSLGRVGEAGHVRIPAVSPDRDPIAVEDVLDAAAFLRSARRITGETVTWESLARAGDDLSPGLIEQRRDWQRTLGWLTSTMVWLLDPDLIVFGGSGATLLAHDRAAFNAALVENGIDAGMTAYTVSDFGSTSTTMGAVSLPMREFFAIPHDIFTAPPSPADDLDVVS